MFYVFFLKLTSPLKVTVQGGFGCLFKLASALLTPYDNITTSLENP